MTLPEYITARLTEPFEWGRHDCVLFASGWILEATGINCVEGLNTWSNAREAAAVIDSVGGLEAAIDALFERVDPNFAQDGDIALFDGIVMIYSGAQLVGPGKSGLTFVGRAKAEIAWGVN